MTFLSFPFISFTFLCFPLLEERERGNETNKIKMPKLKQEYFIYRGLWLHFGNLAPLICRGFQQTRLLRLYTCSMLVLHRLSLPNGPETWCIDNKENIDQLRRHCIWAIDESASGAEKMPRIVKNVPKHKIFPSFWSSSYPDLSGIVPSSRYGI